ncbi:MAG: methyltransferase [Acidobacteria bacterium]|nr:methyltransferase [Acidobacteriota bacterium]
MQTVAAPRFRLIDRGAPGDTFAADVAAGLTAAPKSIPPQYFYDSLGSALFEAICELPEYYVTRAETEILTSYSEAIARALPAGARIVELGSGSARKTRLLIEAILHRRDELHYVPLDIDAGMLEKAGSALLGDFPSLRITAVSGDFRRPSLAIPPAERGEKTVVLFLGSSIGNLTPEEAVATLRDLRSALAPGDALFLGADLRKPRAILEPAYDDALGVTAAFNLNLLQRINRELDARFRLDRFRHRAFYDERLGRIEMHLVSREAQQVRIGALGLLVGFEEGETIHTENSWKYDDASLALLARESGFAIEQHWSDSNGWFADVLMVVR